MTDERKACQDDDMIPSSNTYPKIFYYANRLRAHGLRGTFNRVLSLLGLRRRVTIVEGNRSTGKTGFPWEEQLNLQPGDLVQVRLEAEIRQTLDKNGRLKGLAIMPEMLEYCGKQLKVHKRVERIFIENTQEVRRMKNTVLLEGALCGGWEGSCDRSCFFYWREAWLRKVDNN
jgi:hypothetical protein